LFLSIQSQYCIELGNTFPFYFPFNFSNLKLGGEVAKSFVD